jgi:hypothetical protein
MAQRTTVSLEDDLDGGAADETVRFAVDGAAYEIDLSTKNAGDMRDVFRPYVTHARRAGGRFTPSGGPAAPRRPRSGRVGNGKIRTWAATEAGIHLSERGRIPASVRERYEAATAGGAPASNGAAPSGKPATREGMRAWLKANGHAVKDQGIIAAKFVKIYNEAHGIS